MGNVSYDIVYCEMLDVKRETCPFPYHTLLGDVSYLTFHVYQCGFAALGFRVPRNAEVLNRLFLF